MTQTETQTETLRDELGRPMAPPTAERDDCNARLALMQAGAFDGPADCGRDQP